MPPCGLIRKAVKGFYPLTVSKAKLLIQAIAAYAKPQVFIWKEETAMRILIVEDEYSLADALREILKKEKYTVDISDNGQDGLYQALTGIYDAVVLDVMLPEMNGFEVLQNMRAEGIKTPVLMLTAKSGLDDKVQGLDCKAEGYNKKKGRN